jgi:hypothetical protein
MASVSLRVWSPPAAAPGQVALPLDEPGTACTARLRCLDGANALHLALLGPGGDVLARAEIEAAPGETVTVEVERTASGDLYAWSTDAWRRVLTLPPDLAYDPAPPLPPPAASVSLDLVLLVDLTLRHRKSTIANDLLLDLPEVWGAEAARLTDFVAALAAKGHEHRIAVAAFGDEAPPGAEAADLRPLYHLYPETSWQFGELDLARLPKALAGLPATTGADIVDALADGLHACLQLPWRGSARKLVVVCGDSPGHSTLHPLPAGADAGVRRLDVDAEAAALHRRGVEIATLYYPPPAELQLELVEFQHAILSTTREQYARLASLPEMAFVASALDPAAAGAGLAGRTRTIGRGAALAEWMDCAASA